MNTEDLTSFIYQSHAASQQLAHLEAKDKNQVLLKIAEAVKTQRNQILEANTLDLEASRDMAIPELVLEWLRLTPDRLQHTIDCIKQLATMPDPLSYQSDRSGHRSVSIGAVAFIYEAFPQLSLIAAGMCFKAGNSLILKGGSEVSHSQEAIAEITGQVIRNYGLPDFSLKIAPRGCTIKDLVTQEKYLRLILPYGRPTFVQQICKQSTVSILPAAIGNCYMYLSPSGNLDHALEIIKASRQGDPDPVNAIEKVVIHAAWLSPDRKPEFTNWLDALQKQGLTLRGCDAMVGYYRCYSSDILEDVSSESLWGQAYLDDILAIRVVQDLPEAIAWINQYSSGHADVILTDSLAESHTFTEEINSSNVFVNIHTKFSRQGHNGAIALGMSSLKNRGVSRFPGAIGLDALTTTKRIIQ